MLRRRKFTASVSGSTGLQRVICTGALAAVVKPKTGSPAGGITSIVLRVGSSLGAANSKIARSMLFKSAGVNGSGDKAGTGTPAVPASPCASAGCGLTNRIDTDLIEPAVAYAILSSAKPSVGESSAL